MSKPTEPFDRWHKRYPKPERGYVPCRCGSRKRPLYPSADHGRGQQWQARYTDINGKERRACLATWQEAREHLDRALADLHREKSPNPADGLAVGHYAAQLIERRHRRQKNSNTTAAYDGHLRNHVLPFVGNRRASTLRRRDSMAFVDCLLDKPGINSPATVVQIFKTWRILLHYMADEDVSLPSNIVARIELPEVPPRVKVVLSLAHVAAVKPCPATGQVTRVPRPRYGWPISATSLRIPEAWASLGRSSAPPPRRCALWGPEPCPVPGPFLGGLDEFLATRVFGEYRADLLRAGLADLDAANDQQRQGRSGH
ncbi:hypothetical protein [Streptomyces phaeochromogenes]